MSVMLKIEAISFVCVVTLLLLFCCQISNGQQTERVKIPLCNDYDQTSFRTPNFFNHTSQDQAIFHLHTFAPLIASFCHRDLVFFTCLVHIPAYEQRGGDVPVENQPACRSLCEAVFNSCQYAMAKLNFRWPDEISCEKFGDPPDCGYERNPKNIPDEIEIPPPVSMPSDCSDVAYHGGTPICSTVISSLPNNKYFVSVNAPFANYFNHTRQDQAIYELSKHVRLVHLLISQQPDLNGTNEVTQCLNDVRFLLCNLYIPRCGDKTPQDYPITKTQCENTLGKNCTSAISQLRNRGYDITWPPVDVNCDVFSENSSPRVNPQFGKQRTFNGLSPPPPAVEISKIGKDFLEIKWNAFPKEYKFGTTDETGILYRKSGSRVQYKHEHTTDNTYIIRALNLSTAYEFNVGTVNNASQFPGTFEKITIVQGVESVTSSFCSRFYNLTRFPNMFGDKTQDDAIFSMHTFPPLLRTGCSSKDLETLMCSAYIPNYLAKEQVTMAPCRRLCEAVFDRCAYAIGKLNFKWPEELKCDNLLEQPLCLKPSITIGGDEGCEAVEEQSICSLVTKFDGTPQYSSVEKPFQNYFKHTSQQQAVYELNKHAKFLSMISTLITADEVNRLAYSQCVEFLTPFLCSLYLPRCRAPVEISQAQCTDLLDSHTRNNPCFFAVSELRVKYGYSITWPPVQVNCSSMTPFENDPSYQFGQLQFQNTLPPPAGLSYTTSGKSAQFRRTGSILGTSSTTGLEILFKPVNTDANYTHVHSQGPSANINLNLDTRKDYEILVAYLDAKDKMPGHFERFTYIHGSSVFELREDVGPCSRLYKQAILPNRFGDNTTAEAKLRLYPFFPLIYTLCSEDLLSFLCSAIFPPFTFNVQRPCKSTCEKIFRSCSYAIARSKFYWPPELQCDSWFPSGDGCFDVTKVTTPAAVEPLAPPDRRLSRRSVEECKPTTTNMCLAIKKPSVTTDRPLGGATDSSFFASTFSGGRVNYFNHTTTDQAIYELSQHLRLLSTLRNDPQRSRDALACLNDLTILLCHLYLPACPREPLAKDNCSNTLSNTSACFRAISALNTQGHDLKWPPVEVNCLDKTWFSTNGTRGLLVDVSEIAIYTPLPPPQNIRIDRQTTEQIIFTLTSFRLAAGTNLGGYGVLYRKNNSTTTYSTHRQPALFSVRIGKLSSKTEYEMKVASLDGVTSFPGFFRTITSRTLDPRVLDIPSSVDICYNYYRKTLLPNMFGDENIASAKQRFLPFYPLIYKCSRELEPFVCSVFLPRYNPVTYSSQRPCRHDCERVFKRCSYAIGQLRFFWPPEFECSQFTNDATCYNLTKETPQTDERSFEDALPQRRRRRRGDDGSQCQQTPSTHICSQITRNRFGEKGAFLGVGEYFSSTNAEDAFSNFFNHSSVDEAVYELSNNYLNLLSSLRWDVTNSIYQLCFRKLAFLLCHLHFPSCPSAPTHQETCIETLGNTSSCFGAIRDLNNKGAKFPWPPVKVNCSDKKWFSTDIPEDSYDLAPFNELGPPAPRKIEKSSQSAFKLTISFLRTAGLNTTALYRRSGTTEPYQYISPSSSGVLSIKQLAPATDYEIQLATLKATSGFPGAFTGVIFNTFGQCQNDTTGEEVTQGKFNWKPQTGNTRQETECPYGEIDDELDERALPEDEPFSGRETSFLYPGRYCECDNDTTCKKPFWLEPEVHACNYKVVNDSDEVTASLLGIFQMLDNNEISLRNASEDLANITSLRAPEFEEDDVILSTLILEAIVSGTGNLNETGTNIVNAINNLLNAEAGVILESQQESNTSARIISVLEQYLEEIPLEVGQNVTHHLDNIAVHTQEYEPRDFQGAGAASIEEKDKTDDFAVYNSDSQSTAQSDISQVSMTMPRSLFQQLDIDAQTQNQRITFAIYRKTSFFEVSDKNTEDSSDSEEKTVRKSNSFVVSGSVKDQRLTNLSDPIVTTYRPLEPGIDQTTACVFWNFTGDDGAGDWSPIGCAYQGIKDGVVTCHCTHLTNFAILMDVHVGGDRDDSHDKALSIISYIGCAISLVGLVLTIITILIFKDLRSKVPTQILLNFCIALSLVLIVFLAAAERSKTSSRGACRAAAIALHYFVLVMFVWTSIQAYNMYLAFVKVMPTYHANFMLKCCVVGWGFPAVIVIITAAAAPDDYAVEDFCRVQGLPFQVGLLAPVILILLLNSVAFVFIIRSLLSAGTKVAADKRATGLQHARRGAAILVVLGLTWIFGILAIRDAQIVFQYLFCIFNSIQGLLVFIFYCVLSVETRAKYRRLCGGKSKEATSTGKNRYHASSSEGKFHEVNKNKRVSDNVYTTSTLGSSAVSSQEHKVKGDVDNQETLLEMSNMTKL